MSVVTQDDLLRHYRSGDLLSLKSTATRIISADSANFTALTGLGLSLQQSSRPYDWRKGLAVYRKVLEQSENQDEAGSACGSLARLNILLRDYSTAADYITQAFREGRHNPGLPYDEHASVFLCDSLGEAIFEATRLDPHECPPLSKASPHALRLAPLLERSGFVFADNPATPTCSARAYALKNTDGKERQVSAFKPSPKLSRRWLERLAELPRPWIAFSWTGGGDPERVEARTLPPHIMADIMHGQPGTWLDIQHNTSEGHAHHVTETRNYLREKGIDTIKPETEGLDDLAALVSCVDLIVTADNSNAYMGGALRVPVLALVCQYPYDFLDMRVPELWHTLETIEQQRFMDWDPVVSEARQRLEARLSLVAA